ncbi:protein ROOT HAIR SPECIFIC 17-like isoform X2 [Hevea brasiliensis]|uniref:protein ROOT HAIR SPECIFIC 17 isoform X2 n=1 Tax=Hevea brasiliensis TaxID=3981 RepID=UPI0025D13EFD|nr:protein ROOT HAIR SPECIFIC 17 isoform X2 [Hevea brasiliensis]XP_058001975.1 protein ROOT HAIR SPECIFIC 17-like isoform X2 [Hevea brasiliensis]
MKNKKRDNSHSFTAGVYRIFLVMLRRHHLFHLLYAFSCCLILLFVAFSLFFSPPPVANHHHSMENEESIGHDFWSSRLSKFYYGCSNASGSFQTADVKTNHNRYLLIATSGGLNQQRTGITDAVVAAYILNATLVVPKLDEKSFWKDTSNFSEIFDVDWFISFLSKDVKIIKQLPMKLGKVVTPYYMRVPRKCTPKCYENRVLPIFNKKHAIQLGKFDYRLSNRLDMDLQKLRCRVNYHALKFTDSILEMGKKLVERMRMKCNHFIALHLRFEADMLAFSGCYYGGGEKEKIELGAIRKRWLSLHQKNPEKVQRQGRCPLTPEEVGLMLRALGFGSDIHIYVASGEVYGGEETLIPLKALFPNFHSKETLASKEELAPFSLFSSRMAALDFIVCDESDVFVTNNNGNMARMLAGRRRYFGHKPTIKPNAKKLYRLFLNRHNMTWEEFASKVRTHQIGFMGGPNEVKPGRGEFHENPSSCICEDSEAKAGEYPTPHSYMHEGQGENNKKNVASYVSDELLTVDDHDQDWSDMDYVNGIGAQRKEGLYKNTLIGTDQPELEVLFAD